MEGDLGRAMTMAEKVDVWHAQGRGSEKGQKWRKLGVRDNCARDKNIKEHKKLGLWKKGSMNAVQGKWMTNLKVRSILDPLLWLPRGQAPRSIRIKINRKWT